MGEKLGRNGEGAFSLMECPISNSVGFSTSGKRLSYRVGSSGRDGFDRFFFLSHGFFIFELFWGV